MADICLKSATCDVFSPYKGAQFTVSPVVEDNSATKEYTFTLADAAALPTPKVVPEGCRAAPFTLSFQGPQGLLLQQGIYNVTHPECGTAQIFLVPVTEVPGGSASTVFYQAVFS